MSDDIHHPVAEAMREARKMSDQIEQVNRPISGATSPFFGQGIGNVGAYVVLFGMVGAILGGLLGRSLMGAVAGAVVVGGIFGVIAFVGKLTSRIWNRGPVILWVLLGSVAFFFLGALLNSDPINWAVSGAMIGGAFRYMMKD